ncbi:MAG: hypothetical protein RR137_10955 [Odoribacter sp.]
MLRKICGRIYDDFFRGSRLELYDKMLKDAIANEYHFYTIEDFNKKIIEGSLDDTMKYAIIRHDIDTDPLTAYKLFQIERKYNIKSTYYFRLSTINKNIIAEISNFGSEVSYHYEEIASYAKSHRIKSKKEIEKYIDNIRNEFINNLLKFRTELNLPCLTIASHGDFVNKYLGITNYDLLNDVIRVENNIQLEAYDTAFMKFVTSRIADLGVIDGLWTPRGFYESIATQEKVLYILIHPRQWYSRISSNVKEELKRLYEGLKYNF